MDKRTGDKRAGDKRTGGCLCGAVRFTATPKPHDDGMHVDACHCDMCRRQIGGPLMAVASDALEVTRDDGLRVYQSSDWAERGFCGQCGSNLFWRLRDGSFATVNAGALDDLSGAKLTSEIFVDQKPDYYDFAQPTQKLTASDVRTMFGFN